MTSAAPTLLSPDVTQPPARSAAADLAQETFALCRRLFLQLLRRPSTLVAGVLQPLIWLVLFGALFANAPAGLLPDGLSYGRFLGAGVIVFTAFSAALNAGLPVMFDREFGFLNRLLVAPLRSRSSIVLASVLYITALSLVQSLAIMATAAALGYGWPGGSGLLLVLVTQAFLNKTVTGRAMQAVAQNTESASVLGINVPRMIFYTFAINAVLAAAAALLVTPTYLAKFDMGESLGTKAFFAAIIGGFNNSRGALLGGLIVGVCENLAAAYISPAYKDAVALVIFMVVILFKPQGLLGRKEERKV